MKIEKMDAEKWQKYVDKEYTKIVRCKLGVLQTEKNERIGPKPSYTFEEKKEIISLNKDKVISHMLNDLKDIFIEMNLPTLVNGYIEDEFENYESISDIYEGAIGIFLIHPDAKAWEERAAKIGEEFTVREVVLEKEATNQIRNFVIGVYSPSELNKRLDEFENSVF